MVLENRFEFVSDSGNEKVIAVIGIEKQSDFDIANYFDTVFAFLKSSEFVKRITDIQIRDDMAVFALKNELMFEESQSLYYLFLAEIIKCFFNNLRFTPKIVSAEVIKITEE